MTRILIADDHEVIRSGLRRVLEAQPGWEVVAEASDGKDAIRKAALTKPDVAVLDCMMPLVNGVEATRQIRARVPETEVLIFTLHEDERLIEEILRAGARGYVLKSDVSGQLLDAVQALAEHKPFFTSAVSEALLASMLTPQMNDGICLTDEERTVVRLIAEGHSNREVAKFLDIARKAVESRRTAIMRKLKLPSAAALVLYAIRTGLIEP
jgi:DNA-binding NarL/FixJ family response regulator